MPDVVSIPLLEDWRKLYKAALEFKELAPWDWMGDTDLFGVQNPQDQKIGYCCILGAVGEFFGLAVYSGTAGLTGYLKIQSGEIGSDNDTFEVLLSKKCLVASFENKEYLLKDDLAVIKKLGLVFRGSNAWPQFRNYEPGYHPWFLTKEQARYLTLCLEQAKDITLKFKDNPDMLTPSQKNLYFVRVVKKEDEKTTWKDAWLEPQALKKPVPVSMKLDNERLKRIASIASKTKMIWQIDSFYTPACVSQKKERPYYSLTFMCVNPSSDFVLKVHFVQPGQYEEGFVEYFLSLTEELQILPSELQVNKEELFIYLEPIAAFFNIELKSVKRLAALENARRSMFNYLNKGDRYAR